MTPLLVALGAIVAPAAAPSQQQCAWGAGAAAQQPAAESSPLNLTCTPPSLVGPGTAAVAADTALLGPEVYLDAQLFSYHPKPKPTGDGKVKVALLSMGGADGHSPLSTSLQYLDKAGSLGTDLAVLPENFAQKHVGKVGDMDPPPQPVTGSIITAVAGVARKHGMFVVAPIREKRGASEILNTAVVLARNGSIIGRYSKLFPVLGPPDALGPGSREQQVYPSNHGVVAVDLEGIGRISLAICFDISKCSRSPCVSFPSHKEAAPDFGEIFHQAANLGADILVWPSAMKTP